MITPQEPPEAPPEAPSEAPASRPATGRARAIAARWPWLAAAAAGLLLLGIIALLYTLIDRGGRPLYPNLPTFTPVSGVVEGEATVIDFEELNADPEALRDRRIQVSGEYASIAPPTCLPFAGPVIRWSLVGDELQLNATGFEAILRLVAEGTPMTVTGIWRLYRGPVGCGKEPPDGAVWFLAVDQIIEPNPLLSGDGIALTVIAGSPFPTLPPLDLSSPTPAATETVTATTTLEPSPTLGAVATFPPQLTTTPDTTPSVTVTPTVTETPGEIGTPDLTGTPTPTGTPGPSPTPSPTGEGGPTTPGIPTATPGGTGYPDPEPTTGYP